MNYLIITKSHEPFFTNWYDYENHYDPDEYVMVFNLYTSTYSRDGKTWQSVTIDHL